MSSNTIFANAKLDVNHPSKFDWSEKQYNQLKNQIIAYKFLIRNLNVPNEIINNIRNFSLDEWEEARERKIEKVQKIYKEKFENQDFTMKELGNYFKQRYKEEGKNILNPERNLKNELEYNIESEIENRKNKINSYIKNIEKKYSNNNSEQSNTDNSDFLKNSQLIKNLKEELQILNMYNIQKKTRKDVILDFLKDYEKNSLINSYDNFLYRMLLDRRVYKKPITYQKKDQEFNRFEQQLRNGFDMRKKEKQKEFLHNVLNQHKEFMEFHKEKKQKLKKRALMCKSNIENLEIKDKKEKERQERERINFLKQNNMEEYKKLLAQVKDSRLEEFMNQTDQFLKEIEDKIKLQKANIINHIEKKEEEEEKNEENESKESNDNKEQKTEKKNQQGLLHIIDEEKTINDKNLKEKVSNSKNYYLSAHSQMEEISTQPKMLKFGKLKSYQITGLQWLVSLYVNNLNGILADEMGLGKTIQTIALLCYIMETKHNEGPFLIIAPLATISNWSIEFSRWAPDIKVGVYRGTPAQRRQLSQQLKNDRHKNNVILTTYEYIMKDKYSLNKILWQYIIVDEGHRMKNYKSKFTQTLGTQFNSVYRLLLTGTPLQNNLSELWALLNFLLPKIFNSCEDFEKWFNQPFSSKLPGEKNAELTEEQELLIINRLHTVLRPFLLRREKKDVEKELPSKKEYVIKLGLSSWQELVYKQMKEEGLLAEDPTTGKMEKKKLMNIMMQLRKICNHPYLFLDYNNEFLQHLDKKIFTTSGKFEFLDRIIPKLLFFNHKILIFSQMTHLMDILELYFIYKGIRFLRLDGNTKADDRGIQIDLFSKENGEYKIFILSTRAGGLGLNLQAADTVIIFDSDWNPQMDIQAQDRAHRIGQKHKVLVFRLISKNTIEEGILEKAAFKKSMDEKVIRSGLFKMKYSEQERRKKLLDILKNENEEKEEDDEILDDSTINEYISRSDEEFNKFEEMDRERYKEEKKDEKIEEIKMKLKENGLSDDVKNINYRLMQFYEVPEWVKINKEEKEKIEEVEIGGKDMRVRKVVNYRVDYDEEEFESESESLLKKKKKSSSSNFDSSEGSNINYKKKLKKHGSKNNSSYNNEDKSESISGINIVDDGEEGSYMIRKNNNNFKIDLNDLNDGNNSSEPKTNGNHIIDDEENYEIEDSSEKKTNNNNEKMELEE